jgi:hypothetical protein
LLVEVVARANRRHISGCIWYITHRCHKKECFPWLSTDWLDPTPALVLSLCNDRVMPGGDKSLGKDERLRMVNKKARSESAGF